jgi:mannose-6-phosphate isomerase-like protein (cupin superfamily)
MILSEQFLNDIVGKKHFHWTNTGLPPVDWFSVIDNLEQVAQINPQDIIELKNLGCVVHEVISNKMFVQQEFQNYLMDVFNAPVSLHTYISFTSYSEVFPMHSDDVDVFIVGALGDTEFTVDDPEGTKKYTLVPGDMVYIPAGMKHGARPLSPRICLSYGIEKFPQ